jgi:PAS domain-containing protein
MPFRSIVEGAGDAIVATNAVGEVVFSNRAAKALFGDAVDPAPGRALATLLPGWFDARPVAGSEPKLSSSFGPTTGAFG